MKVAEGREIFAQSYKRFIAKPDVMALLRARAGTDLGRFSLFNIMWILDQAYTRKEEPPEMLATYPAWQSRGRQVLKGSKAWKVLRPIKKMVDETDANGQPTGRKYSIVVYFDVLNEFDVSETAGDPLPIGKYDWLPKGSSAAEHWQTLVDYAESKEITVSVRDTGKAGGWYKPKEKLIAVSDKVDVNAQVSTLIHELLHAQGVDYSKFSQEDAEVIVETGAAIVSMSLGLDIMQEASYYVALWSRNDPAKAMKLLGKADAEAHKLQAALGFGAVHETEEVAA